MHRNKRERVKQRQFIKSGDPQSAESIQIHYRALTIVLDINNEDTKVERIQRYKRREGESETPTDIKGLITDKQKTNNL